MNNRLIINPLIEENMNEMADGQFSISQITGHVDIRKENEIISKTKELWCEALDLKKYKDDIKEKVDSDISKFNDLDDRLKYLENLLKEIFDLIENFKRKLTEYENLSEEIEEKLRYLDKLALSIFREIQLNYNKSMVNNFPYLGKLLIEYEKLERIKDNNYYFTKFVKEHFKYINSDNIIKSYDTEAQIERDWENLNTRVYYSDYVAYKNDCLERIKNIVNTYLIDGQPIVKLTELSFKGAKKFKYTSKYVHYIRR